VFTQALEQLVSLPEHPDWHNEPLQTGFGATQALPQLPQLSGLSVRSTQMPEQLVSPLGQVLAQLPSWQV
jgi:hypothetical protein